MEANPPRRKMSDKNGMLYPMLVIAAMSVIILSVFGVATITGLIPTAQSNSVQQQDSRPKTQPQSVQPPAKPVRATPNPIAAIGREDCGVVDAINAVEVKGKGTGLGMIAGGVTGALIGNEIGRGNGNAVATIAGAAGGAYTGNEIEKNMKKSVRYQVRVRMDDGTYRTLYQSSAPAFAVGEKVKVVNGQVVAAG
jgi:outer membrane lipoprotein SlyB